jgi:hypothetical protein
MEANLSNLSTYFAGRAGSLVALANHACLHLEAKALACLSSQPRLLDPLGCLACIVVRLLFQWLMCQWTLRLGDHGEVTFRRVWEQFVPIFVQYNRHQWCTDSNTYS